MANVEDNLVHIALLGVSTRLEYQNLGLRTMYGIVETRSR